MIALLDGELFEIVPLTTTSSEFSVEIDPPMGVKACIGGKRIDYGVLYRSFNKCADIDPRTGQITVNYPGTASIRAIFHNFHKDLNIEIS